MSRGGRELHPAWALGGAALAHVLVLGALAISPSRSLARVSSSPAPPAHEIEIAFEALDGQSQPSAEPPAAPAAPSVASLGRATRGVPKANQLEPAAELGLPEAASSPEAPAAPPTRAGRKKRVDLGLGGSVTSRLLLDEARAPRASNRPSPGMLQEGLDEIAAARGSARSAPAIQAAYGSAQLGPLEGSAVFDVRADRNGNVISVTLVSFGSSEARWTRVAEDMRRKLAKRKLRVPNGSTGFVARLRIERGALASELPSKARTKRGVAIGQDALGEKDVREESTRAQLEPGTISPSTRSGIGGSISHPTRVVLLSEALL